MPMTMSLTLAVSMFFLFLFMTMTIVILFMMVFLLFCWTSALLIHQIRNIQLHLHHYLIDGLDFTLLQVTVLLRPLHQLFDIVQVLLQLFHDLVLRVMQVGVERRNDVLNLGQIMVEGTV